MEHKYNKILKDYITDEWESINKYKNKKTIIVSGTRGSGKTEVLKGHNNIQNSERLVIEGKFDTIGFSTSCFDEEFLKYYYELLMSLNIINSNHSQLFRHLREIYIDILNNKLTEAENFINNGFFLDNISYDKSISTYDYTSSIINTIKNKFPNRKLTLVIPRFDSIHSGEPIIQPIIHQYFELFDQTIIESQDTSSVTRTSLSKYAFAQINYAKQFDFINDLIKEYFKRYNMLNNDQVTDEITKSNINYIMTKTNGNTRLVIEILDKLIPQYKWEQSKNINDLIPNVVEMVLNSNEMYEKMCPKRKLHIK